MEVNSSFVYISQNNPGAIEVFEEVSELVPVKVTRERDDLAFCEHMLLCLNGLTWTRGEESAALAQELKEAMEADINLVLVHEMPGLEQPPTRHAVEFSTFFKCAAGETPAALIQAGLYKTLAVALKGGPWRKASLAMVTRSLTGSALDYTLREATLREARAWTSLSTLPSRVRVFTQQLEMPLKLQFRVKNRRLSELLPPDALGSDPSAVAVVEDMEMAASDERGHLPTRRKSLAKELAQERLESRRTLVRRDSMLMSNQL